MSYSDEELHELKSLGTSVSVGTEGGHQYVLVSGFALEGWKPGVVDLLICAHARDGYASRLFFSERPTRQGQGQLNWNTSVRILNRNWFAYSYRVPTRPNLRPSQLMAAHLRALR